MSSTPTTKTAATVVHLASHPSWRADQRRARELEAAMRRHPSYQSRGSELHSVS